MQETMKAKPRGDVNLSPTNQSLRTSLRGGRWVGGRAGSSPRLGPTPLAGNRTSCKRPERRGVGEGEARGLYKSAPNAPGVGAAKSSFATVPWQMNTSHANTRIPNLLANKIPSVNIPKKNAHPAIMSESPAKRNMPPKGLFKSRPIPRQRPEPASSPFWRKLCN